MKDVSEKFERPRITVTYLPNDIGVVINDEYEEVSIDLSLDEMKRVIERALLIRDVYEHTKEYCYLIDYT